MLTKVEHQQWAAMCIEADRARDAALGLSHNTDFKRSDGNWERKYESAEANWAAVQRRMSDFIFDHFGIRP